MDIDMNVLFIANTFPSPDQKHVSPFNLRAVSNLKAAGVQVNVLHLRSWKPGRPVKKSYEIDGVNITAISLPFYAQLPGRLKALNILLYKKLFARQIKKVMNMRSIHVIHSVGAAHAGVVAAYLSKQWGIPHIAQCIGSDVNIVLPELSRFLGVKNFESNVDIFSANSNSLAEQAASIFPAVETAVVYRGVNTADFYPDESRRPVDEIVFTYIGGFSVVSTSYGRDEKGGVTLLKAWKQVVEQADGKYKIKLLFGGPRVTAEEVISNTGMDPEALHIEVVGQVSRTQVNSLFQRSHVVIIPSMFEGLPNAGMEAAACGCALIGSDTGGIPEIIRNGKLGILTKPGNTEELVKAIMKMVEDDGFRNTCMALSRPFIQEKFNAAAFAPSYIALYRKVIRNHED